MIRKITVFIVCLCISSIALSQTFSDGDFNYNINIDGATVTVTEKVPDNTDTDIILPNTASDGTTTYDVTIIGSGAFFDNQLTSVTIPNSVKSINDYAFDSNLLSNVTIPNSVTFIGEFAFDSNQLTSVTIPSSVTTIDFNAFQNNLLTHLVIPDSVTTIRSQVFLNNQLTSVIIPNSVTSIEKNAFGFAIPTVSGVGEHTISFLGATPPTIEANSFIESFNESNFDDITITVICGSLDSYINNGSYIGFFDIKEETDVDSSFSYSSNMFCSNGIPQTPTTITSGGAFSTSPNGLAINPTTGSINPLESIPGTYDITYSFGNCPNSTTESITIDEPQVFDDGDLSYEVNCITNTVTVIGRAPGNTDTDISIPSTVSDGITTYDVTIIRENAFRENQLTTVTIPNNTTSIGESAFQGNLLTNVTIGNNVTVIGDSAFENNQLTNITIPSSAKSIGNNAFAFNELINLIFPDNLTNIPDGIFMSNKLTNITIPNSVTNIGRNAFKNNQLTSVTIPSSVTSIGEEAFNDNRLTSVTIPDNLTSIEKNSFRNNQLTSITIPNNVTSISDGAFGFTSPTVSGVGEHTVTFSGNTPPTIDVNSFINNSGDSNRGDITVTVSCGLLETYTNNDNYNGFFEINEGLNTSSTFSYNSSLFCSNEDDQTPTIIIPGGIFFASPNNGLVTIDSTTGVIDVSHSAPGNYDIIYFLENCQNSTIQNITIIDPEPFDNGGLSYEVDCITANATVIGRAAGNTNTDIIIPDTVTDGSTTYDVTAIDEFAFFLNGITSVIIGNKVNSIGSSAFENNPLSELTIGSNVTIIRDGAFLDNQLTNLVIPSSVTTIEDEAFSFATPTVSGMGEHTVTFLGAIPPTIATDSFINSIGDSNHDEITVTVSCGSLEAYRNDSRYTSFFEIKEEIDIDSSFSYNSSLLCSNETPQTPTIITPGGTFFASPSGLDISPTTGSINSLESVSGTYDITYSFGNCPNSTTETITIAEPQVFDDGVLSYEINCMTNVATVIGRAPNNTDTDIIIPNTISNGTMSYNVTAIGSRAFQNNLLTSIIIPNSVTSIGSRSFQNNLLSSISIPNSVTIIEDNAFLNNQLETITIPDSVTSIEIGTFRNNRLTTVTIPDGVTVIRESVFRDNRLATVTIPNSVTSIEVSAFSNNRLKTVTIPDSVTIIEGFAFRGNQLETVTIPDSVTIIEEFAFFENELTSITLGNGLISIGQAVFARNKLATVTIPDNITLIEDDTFDDNELTSVTISNNVTIIGKRAFSNNLLTNITIPNSVTSIEQEAFRDNNLHSVTIGDGAIEIKNLAFQFSRTFLNGSHRVIFLGDTPPILYPSSFYEDIQIQNNREEITVIVPCSSISDYENDINFKGFYKITGGSLNGFESDGISYCLNSDEASVTVLGKSPGNQETDIVIPNTTNDGSTNYDVTIIANCAFRKEELSSVSIPEGVVSIGRQAFQENQISDIIIPKSLTTLGESAFRENQLSSVIIPEGITTIENNTFRENQLSSVIIPESVTSIGEYSFYENNLTSLTIPNSVTSIGESAFRHNQLSSVIISENITTIKEYTFRENFITDIIIPDNITTIEDGAFVFNLLANVTIGNNVTSIGFGAFQDNELTNLTIPESVINIENAAFANNILTDITIPSGVTSLGANAFGFANPQSGDGAEHRITFTGDTPPTIATNSFVSFLNHNIQNEIEVIVPCDAVSTYESADNYDEFLSIIGIDFTANGFSYCINQDDASVTITGVYAGKNNTALIIPSTVSDGTTTYDVTFIGDNAFANNELTSVTIPESVISIGGNAFGFATLSTSGVGEHTVIFLGNTPPTITANSFVDSSGNPNQDDITITVPNDALDIYGDDPSYESFFAIKTNTLSTQENSLENNLSLYPNPAQGQIQLSYAGSEALNNLVITDILGKRVQEVTLNEFTGTQTIDVSRLQTGLYFFTIAGNQDTSTMRVIIK